MGHWATAAGSGVDKTKTKGGYNSLSLIKSGSTTDSWLTFR